MSIPSKSSAYGGTKWTQDEDGNWHHAGHKPFKPEPLPTTGKKDPEVHIVSNLTHSEDFSKSDSRLNSFMKAVGYGVIVGAVVVVGVGLSVVLSGGMLAFLSKGNATGSANPTAFDTALSIHGLRNNLEEIAENLANTHQSLILNQRCTALNDILDCMINDLVANATESNLVKLASEIEIVSQQLTDLSKDVDVQNEQAVVDHLNSLEPNSNHLFQSMLEVSRSAPEKVEPLLLKMLETGNKNPPSAENFKPGQEVSFVDVAENLFAQQKGEAIVKKALELYFSPKIDPKDVIFLQQILETAIEENFCVSLIGENLGKYTYSENYRKYNLRRYDAEDLSLERLFDQINNPYHSLGYSIRTRDDIKRAVWAFKSGRDDENALLNMIDQKNPDTDKKDLNSIDSEIAEQLLKKNIYGEKVINEKFAEIAKALIIKDSGNRVLNSILDRIAKEDKHPALMEIVEYAIEFSPKLISDILLQSGNFRNKIILRELILEEPLDKLQMILKRVIEQIADNPKDITHEILLILEPLANKLPEKSILKKEFDKIFDSLTSPLAMPHSFYEYKSNPKETLYGYGTISEMIKRNYDLDGLDNMLGQLLADNMEGALPNAEIFNANNPLNVYNLIQQLYEKGAAKKTLVSLMRSFIDPNLSHLSKAHFNLLNNLIKQSSTAASVTKINNLIQRAFYKEFENLNSKKERLTLMRYENTLGINELLITSLNRYKELGHIDENILKKNHLIHIALDWYQNLEVTTPKVLKNPLYLEIIKSCADLLPKELMKPLIETIAPNDLIVDENNIFPDFYEIYMKIGKENNEQMLNFARKHYNNNLINAEARKEFEKIIRSAEGKEPLPETEINTAVEAEHEDIGENQLAAETAKTEAEMERALNQLIVAPEVNSNDLYTEMLKTIHYPELTEKMLLKALETGNKNLLSAANFNPGQQVYFIDIAQNLFKQQKGEAIVKKALELYFSPNIDPKDVIFLQQILETAIQKDFCTDQIREALQEHVVNILKKESVNSVKSYMWNPNPQGHSRFSRFDTENLSLRRLADQINNKNNILAGLILYIDTDEVEKAVWNFKSALSNENELLDTINKKNIGKESDRKSLDLIDGEIAKQIFRSNPYGEKAINEDFTEIIKALIIKDSGHNVLNSILDRISKGDKHPALREFIDYATQYSPKLIVDILLNPRNFRNKIHLREIILGQPLDRQEIIVNKLIQQIDSNSKEITDEILLNLKELADRLPDGSIQKKSLGKRFDSLYSKSELPNHIYNYKSNPEALTNSYNRLSKMIELNIDLEGLDKMLSQLLADNMEGALPNQEIFNENNPSNVYNLIQQLHEKGAAKSTIKFLTQSFIDPNLSHASHEHLNLLNNIIKQSSKELVTSINNDLAFSMLTQHSKGENNQLLALKQYESTLGINELLRASLNRYNELGGEIDMNIINNNYLINNAIHEYKSISLSDLKEVKKPLCVEIIKSSIDLLPRELMKPFAKSLVTYGTSLTGETKVMPDFHEIYEKIGKDANGPLLGFALGNYKFASSETREEFKKVILSAGEKLPE